MGLDMMEPRPVDPMPNVVDVARREDAYGNMTDALCVNNDDNVSFDSSRWGHYRPRCVMGGIFEVMEGTA